MMIDAAMVNTELLLLPAAAAAVMDQYPTDAVLGYEIV